MELKPLPKAHLLGWIVIFAICRVRLSLVMIGLLFDSTRCHCVNKLGCPSVDDTVIGRSKVVDSLAEEDITDGFMSSFPTGPREREVLTFRTGVDKPDSMFLQGEPLVSDKILMMRVGQPVMEINLSLYSNGFSIEPDARSSSSNIKFESHAWSPFAVVEKTNGKPGGPAFCAVIALTIFQVGSNDCFFFATSGANAEEAREMWIERIAGAIRDMTISLFPVHAITVQPLEGVESTSNRILAGYLLKIEPSKKVSLLYCELHAYSSGGSRLKVYQDEACDLEHKELFVTEESVVSTRKGDYCTIFAIDGTCFSARTPAEKDLWLRAVTNVKVKLMFSAPDPTDEEMQMIRSAVFARVQELNAIEICANGASPSGKRDPLLPVAERQPVPVSLRGDMFHPLPLLEDDDPRLMEVFEPNKVSGPNKMCGSRSTPLALSGHAVAVVSTHEGAQATGLDSYHQETSGPSGPTVGRRVVKGQGAMSRPPLGDHEEPGDVGPAHPGDVEIDAPNQESGAQDPADVWVKNRELRSAFGRN